MTTKPSGAPADYLLDTNVCIAIRELIKGKTPANPQSAEKLAKVKARWSKVPKEQLFMSIITWGELRYGAEKSGNPVNAKSRLDQLRQAVQVMQLDDVTGEHYGSIRRHLEQHGQTIGPNDLWIAAHGRAKSCSLVTFHTRFPQPGAANWRFGW